VRSSYAAAAAAAGAAAGSSRGSGGAQQVSVGSSGARAGLPRRRLQSPRRRVGGALTAPRFHSPPRRCYRPHPRPFPAPPLQGGDSDNEGDGGGVGASYTGGGVGGHGGGGGPPAYCSECKVRGHTPDQHCPEDGCTDVDCEYDFHECMCKAGGSGHRQGPVGEFIANSRFPLNKGGERLRTCKAKQAANATASYKASKAAYTASEQGQAVRAAYEARAVAEREEAARQLAAANPTLGIPPRLPAQLDALAAEALASPLMLQLLGDPTSSYYIFAFAGFKSGVGNAVDPAAWRAAMALEAEAVMTARGYSSPVLLLRNGRRNMDGVLTNVLRNGALKQEHGWAVQEFVAARSPLVIDVTSVEKRLHQRGKHPLAGVGGHLWLKDGGSPQQQDDSKMYGVAVLYKVGGWLSADGALLLRDDHRAAYLARLAARGVALPAWAAAYAGGGSSGGASGAAAAAAAGSGSSAVAAGASLSSAAASAAAPPSRKGQLSLFSFARPPPVPSPLGSTAAAGVPFTPPVATESGEGGSYLDSRGSVSGVGTVLSFGGASRSASTSASAAAAAAAAPAPRHPGSAPYGPTDFSPESLARLGASYSGGGGSAAAASAGSSGGGTAAPAGSLLRGLPLPLAGAKRPREEAAAAPAGGNGIAAVKEDDRTSQVKANKALAAAAAAPGVQSVARFGGGT
jgi:hypothetical protein